MSTEETIIALQETVTSQDATLCRHLRSKRMYIANSFDIEAQADEDTEHCYGHYWCMRTSYNIGPDDERVARRECKPGRACYEAS